MRLGVGEANDKTRRYRMRLTGQVDVSDFAVLRFQRLCDRFRPADSDIIPCRVQRRTHKGGTEAKEKIQRHRTRLTGEVDFDDFAVL
jgi:hypothetical protein